MGKSFQNREHKRGLGDKHSDDDDDDDDDDDEHGAIHEETHTVRTIVFLF